MNPGRLSSRASIVVTVALAAGVAACSQGNTDKAGSPISKPVVLTIADGQADTTNALPFARAVRTLSHAALQIKIEANWRSGDPAYDSGLIKDVQAGRAQLGITVSGAFDTVGIDTFQALQAPFLIDAIALERKVLASGIAGKMLQGHKPHGLIGLGILPGALRRPLGLARPLLAASDYRGARIGIRASRGSELIFRALGAVPVVLKRDKDVSGLTGVESYLTNIDSEFSVRGATLTGNVVFEPSPDVIFINRDTFGSLSAADQSVLIRAARQAQTSEGVYQADSGSLRDMCRRGLAVVDASPADLAGLHAAEQPVYRQLESRPSTKAFINRVMAMREAGGPPDAVKCSSPSLAARITTRLTPLEGNWAVTYTRSQLETAGPSANCVASNPTNYGHFSLIFDRGHWRLIGIPGTNGNASGTYVVFGDKVTFYRSDHAYFGSDTEIWGPYIWSVYRDTLTFRRAGSGGPCLNVKPWRKIGT